MLVQYVRCASEPLLAEQYRGNEGPSQYTQFLWNARRFQGDF